MSNGGILASEILGRGRKEYYWQLAAFYDAKGTEMGIIWECSEDRKYAKKTEKESTEREREVQD